MKEAKDFWYLNKNRIGTNTIKLSINEINKISKRLDNSLK